MLSLLLLGGVNRPQPNVLLLLGGVNPPQVNSAAAATFPLVDLFKGVYKEPSRTSVDCDPTPYLLGRMFPWLGDPLRHGRAPEIR